MVLNKLKIDTVRMIVIMVYQLDILRDVIVVFILNIDKIFDIHTLCCCRNGILTWYQWSRNNIHRFDNICNKLNPKQDQQQQYRYQKFLTITVVCARMIILIFFVVMKARILEMIYNCMRLN